MMMKPNLESESSSSLSAPVWNLLSHRYSVVLIGLWGSKSKLTFFSLPSSVRIVPTYRTRPFGGTGEAREGSWVSRRRPARGEAGRARAGLRTSRVELEARLGRRDGRQDRQPVDARLDVGRRSVLVREHARVVRDGRLQAGKRRRWRRVQRAAGRTPDEEQGTTHPGLHDERDHGRSVSARRVELLDELAHLPAGGKRGGGRRPDERRQSLCGRARASERLQDPHLEAARRNHGSARSGQEGSARRRPSRWPATLASGERRGDGPRRPARVPSFSSSTGSPRPADELPATARLLRLGRRCPQRARRMAPTFATRCCLASGLSGSLPERAVPPAASGARPALQRPNELRCGVGGEPEAGAGRDGPGCSARRRRPCWRPT